MKNPMTLQEQHAAIDDTAAGYDMQYRRFNQSGGVSKWEDRASVYNGEPLNFAACEYRRKPRTSEDILKRAVDWWLEDGMQKFIGAPAWVFAARELLEPEPAMPPMNPWRPIVKGEWPECKPAAEIVVRWANGTEYQVRADSINWSMDHISEHGSIDATHWKYAEDE